MVTGPSSNPSGERAPRPGVTWQTTIGWTGERLVADDEPEPRPNRATRRALARRTETFDHEPMDIFTNGKLRAVECYRCHIPWPCTSAIVLGLADGTA
ncbi:hypothetical protein CP979_26365 [Streptomyces filamentosus]|nr:hypothetical protein CP979_26365 [Streptomyces filamentosus]